MAPALRKRAAVAGVGAAAKRRKQPKIKPPESKTPPEDATKRKSRPSKGAISAPEIGIQGIPAPPYLPVSNPQATLLGLPAELRLNIYTYLTDTTLIHVHRHWNSKKRRHYFTWTPCKGANPNCQLLCANPKWSGFCPEEDRCTYKFAAPPDPRGFWGLAAACKFIRNEAQEFFMRNTVISIDPLVVRSWLKHLTKYAPSQLENLRKVTLAGWDMYNCIRSSSSGFSINGGVLMELRDKAPNLEAVALQCMEPRVRWFDYLLDPNIGLKAIRKNWPIANSMKMFAPTVTLAIEGFIWLGKRRVKVEDTTKTMKEQQIVFRLIRDGKAEGYEGTGWEADDVKLEMVQPGGLVEPERDAQWRIWWYEEKSPFRK